MHQKVQYLPKSKRNGRSIQMNYLSQPALDRISRMEIFEETCAGHQIFEHIANKWMILIIYALTQGKKRYSDLQRQICGISPKMLIQTLRNLERCGLIQRHVYPVVPPKVEYQLTELGMSLVEPLATLGEWAYQHLGDVKTAIEAYDEKLNSQE
jgi:DNA-binding HxlR family transcriptional regulator